jgi:hypothetical protein
MKGNHQALQNTIGNRYWRYRMRVMKLKLRIISLQFVLLLSLSLLYGCLLSTKPYKKVTMFDLGTPASLNVANAFIQVEPFMNESPCTGRMYYRVGKNIVEADDYNRWVQDPAAMLTSYLITAFKSRKNLDPKHAQPSFIVTGKVIQFAIDFNESDVVFTVDYQVRQSVSNILLIQDSKTYRKPYSSKTPEAFAVAMSNAVEAFADNLKLDVLTLLKSKRSSLTH